MFFEAAWWPLSFPPIRAQPRSDNLTTIRVLSRPTARNEGASSSPSAVRSRCEVIPLIFLPSSSSFVRTPSVRPTSTIFKEGPPPPSSHVPGATLLRELPDMISAKFWDFFDLLPHLDLIHTIKFTQPLLLCLLFQDPHDADIISVGSPTTTSAAAVPLSDANSFCNVLGYFAFLRLMRLGAPPLLRTRTCARQRPAAR